MLGGASGFSGCPISKTLVVGLLVASVCAAVSNTTHFFQLSRRALFSDGRIERVLLHSLVFSTTAELTFGLILLYYFRLFERQWGSRKYAWFCSLVVLLSVSLEVAALFFGVSSVPSGPYSLVFSHFVPFVLDIPESSSLPLFGWKLHDKMFVYIMGFQLLVISYPAGWLSVLIGILCASLFRVESCCRLTTIIRWPLVGWCGSSWMGRWLFHRGNPAVVESGDPISASVSSSQTVSSSGQSFASSSSSSSSSALPSSSAILEVESVFSPPGGNDQESRPLLRDDDEERSVNIS